jgi:hypothetical protein
MLVTDLTFIFMSFTHAQKGAANGYAMTKSLQNSIVFQILAFTMDCLHISFTLIATQFDLGIHDGSFSWKPDSHHNSTIDRL